MKSTASNELDYNDLSDKIMDEIYQIVEQLELNNTQTTINKGNLENLRKSVRELRIDLEAFI